MQMQNVPTADNVEIKSAWKSKINVTQVVAGGAMIVAYATGGKVGLDPTQQAAVVVVIGLASQAFTWVLRTWFTTKLTTSSANKL